MKAETNNAWVTSEILGVMYVRDQTVLDALGEHIVRGGGERVSEYNGLAHLQSSHWVGGTTRARGKHTHDPQSL